MKKYLLLLIIPFLLCCKTNNDKTVHLITIGATYSNTHISLNAPYYDVSSISYCFSKLLDSSATNYTLKIFNEKYGEKALKKNIISYLKDLETKKNDLIIFYFSGHSVNKENSEEFKPSLILESNDYNYLDKIMDSSVCLTNIELFNILSSKKASSILMLDCCYSGNFLSSDSISLLNKGKFISNNIFTLCSSKSTELSFEPLTYSNTVSHGYFTTALLDSLLYFTSNNQYIYKTKGYTISSYGTLSKTYILYLNMLISRCKTIKIRKQHPCYSSSSFNIRIN